MAFWPQWASVAESLNPGLEGSILQTRGGNVVWYPPQANGSLIQVVNGLPSWITGVPPGDGSLRSLIYNPQTSEWAASNHNYRTPPIVNPSGFPAGSPNIRLALNEHSLADTSGNGLNASLSAGTERYSWLTPTNGAFNFDGSTGLVVNGAQPLLALTGDMTLIFAGIIRAKTGAIQFMIGYASIPETEADNTLYSMFYNADGSVSFISESGAGVNFTHTVNSWAEVGQPFLGGFTRSNNRIQFYLNRSELDAPSAAGPTPTGGSNSRFRIGAREGGDLPFGGVINGVVVYPFAITLAQWRAMFNATMGPLYGFVED